MKWFKGANATDWGIEISPEGRVTEVQYERSMERRTFKRDAQMHEEELTTEVMHEAFLAIITASDEGAHMLTKEVTAEEDKTVLYNTIFDHMDDCLQLLKELARDYIK